MATVSTEETSVASERSDEQLAGETEEERLAKEPCDSGELKPEEAEGEPGNGNPAEEEAVAEEEVTGAAAPAGDAEAEKLTPGLGSEEEGRLEENSPAERTGDKTVKEVKLEQGSDESPPPASDCGNSETTSSDAAEENLGTVAVTAGGELDDKRRASVEVSSSDGEPLSRMDSEDSISSTLMDLDSTVSSGRSSPAMMNGQGSASSSSSSSSSAKSVSHGCCWERCPESFSCSPDLAEHIRAAHVDDAHGQRGGAFVCLWKGCKVYNTPSTSHSWLQRHMLTHSGDKPFKCVVGGCNASFASQGGLARHVPTHFSQQSKQANQANQAKLKEESPSKAGLNKRKKLKNKRRGVLQSPTSLQPARPFDFFDAQTMDAIRDRAIRLNLATRIESAGNGHSIVFQSTVLARRTERSGKVKVLLHWTPEDILPDAWVNETDRSQLKTKVVHLSQLPLDTAMLLDPNIYRALPRKRLKRSL